MSKILDGLKDDGGEMFSISDAEGVHYESRSQYLGHLLGFCGCGMPDTALAYVYEGMSLIKARSDSDYSAESVNKLLEFGGSDGAKYFFWYRLDDLDFTEHGGSVPGWLTDKGKDFLLALEETRHEWQEAD